MKRTIIHKIMWLVVLLNSSSYLIGIGFELNAGKETLAAVNNISKSVDAVADAAKNVKVGVNLSDINVGKETLAAANNIKVGLNVADINVGKDTLAAVNNLKVGVNVNADVNLSKETLAALDNAPKALEKACIATVQEAGKQAQAALKPVHEAATAISTSVDNLPYNTLQKFKSVPVIVLGLASGLYALWILKDTIEKTYQADGKEARSARKRGVISCAAGLVLLLASIATVANSDLIISYFSANKGLATP